MRVEYYFKLPAFGFGVCRVDVQVS